MTHYEVQRETNPWVTVADEVTDTRYVDTDVEEGDSYRYRIRAVNDWDHEGPLVAAHGGHCSVEAEIITDTQPVYRVRAVNRTGTVTETVGEAPFARFSPSEVSRSVAENSAPGSPVGAPLTVLRNSGNKVAYSLEGPDAALFTIEQDSGQILVGEGTLLDYESGVTSYTVDRCWPIPAPAPTSGPPSPSPWPTWPRAPRSPSAPPDSRRWAWS